MKCAFCWLVLYNKWHYLKIGHVYCLLQFNTCQSLEVLLVVLKWHT
jgi:hypothetical protein